MSDQIDISIVIATCNRAKVLEPCLAAIGMQTLAIDRFEVVVVNDGSTDETMILLEQIGKQFPAPFFVIHQENKGVAAARNAGVAKARGRFVAFTDDDCLVPENWLSRILDNFEISGPDIIGVGGPLDSFTDSDDKLIGHYVKYLDEFNHIPVLGRWLVRPRHVSRLTGAEVVPYLRTSNAAFRRDALLKVKGFDVDFHRPGGEDPDLCYRLLTTAGRFRFDSELVVDHHTRDSFQAYFCSLKNYVNGDFRTSKKKDQYQDHVIRRSYSFLFGQKLASLSLSVVGYPFRVINAKRDGFSSIEAFLFPLLVAASKFYAVWLAFVSQFTNLDKEIRK